MKHITHPGKRTFVSVACGLFLLVLWGCCENGVRTEAVTLEKAEWIGALRTTFDGISLRLNIIHRMITNSARRMFPLSTSRTTAI